MRRVRKFEDQFPQSMDLIAGALRAGHAFTTAISMVADEVADPTGAEFRLIYDQQNFGMPLPDALKAFAKRVPLLDARFFITAVLTQREAGGNLAEVLDNLAGADSRAIAGQAPGPRRERARPDHRLGALVDAAGARGNDDRWSLPST